jgi:hypothetical protein
VGFSPKYEAAGQQLGAFGEGSLWLAKIRVVGAVGRGWPARPSGPTMDLFVPVETVFSVVPVSL